MFSKLINGLLSTLGFAIEDLNQHVITTYHDSELGMKGGVDNIKCIILNSYLTNTNSSITLAMIQPLLPSGWTCSEADFFLDDTAMLLTEFKIDVSKVKDAPRGILINRSKSRSTASDLLNM
tara:strand:- start:10199 stop:10564 length:366 start_codon:yes stop_codon:yes gene_type:complete